MSNIYGEIAEIINVNISPERDANNLSSKTYELQIQMRVETAHNCIVYGFGSNLIPQKNIIYIEKILKDMYDYSDNDDIRKLIGQKVAIYGYGDHINRIRNPINNKSMKLRDLRCTK